MGRLVTLPQKMSLQALAIESDTNMVLQPWVRRATISNPVLLACINHPRFIAERGLALFCGEITCVEDASCVDFLPWADEYHAKVGNGWWLKSSEVIEQVNAHLKILQPLTQSGDHYWVTYLRHDVRATVRDFTQSLAIETVVCADLCVKSLAEGEHLTGFTYLDFAWSNFCEAQKNALTSKATDQ